MSLFDLFSFGSKDSKSESEDNECDHDWEFEPAGDSFVMTTNPVKMGYSRYFAPKYENGHIIFHVVQEKKRTCTKCDEESEIKLGQDGKIALPVAYELDDAMSLDAVLTEPVESDDSDSDEGGRVIVNESEFGVTD